ncbi:hypothetical protein [Aequorivita viscosa]|uniref:Beta-lactamase-inhibitor-like, PepSY-like n=1 Tax=Aequorivita viscosa TaxID=797419 RepID=A0A1M6L7L2_9FLAO|nr:hypothetical protein [Aequorivita viscosa]SDX22524.1 hypothetical protein SAMN05216556_12114 [Aequorivita viscosa]SHJ67177.1 hypothetical protein SAMN04487908_12253 [Aequorivita viscosa]
MKKLLLSTAIVLGGLTVANAQATEVVSAKNKTVQASVETESSKRLIAAQSATAVQNYKEVMVSELPQSVKNTVAKNFNGATISKAYVNAQGDYKIHLATNDAKTATVYVNANGEMIKNELKKQ